jgi:hypothetical protein
MRHRRHRPAYRARVVPVAYLYEGAQHRDADLQAAYTLVFQRMFGAR